MANELIANLFSLESAGEILFLEETGHSLADKVLRKIQDGSYSWVDIVDEFNTCLDYLAGKYNLPDLEHTEDVSTNSNVGYIPMPANFQKNLWYCKSLTHNRVIDIKDSVINLYRHYTVLDQSGPVQGVSVKGNALHYQRIPGTAEVLRLIYYRYPTRLRSRYDKPVCLPPHMVEPLLVNYACREIYGEIEDGIEGKQVNTDRYGKKFAEAEVELDRLVGPPRHAPIDLPDEMAWDAYV